MVPLYFRVPLSTRFEGRFDDWPIELAEPPLAKEVTCSVPPPVMIVRRIGIRGVAEIQGSEAVVR